METVFYPPYQEQIITVKSDIWAHTLSLLSVYIFLPFQFRGCRTIPLIHLCHIYSRFLPLLYYVKLVFHFLSKAKPLNIRWFPWNSKADIKSISVPDRKYRRNISSSSRGFRFLPYPQGYNIWAAFRKWKCCPPFYSQFIHKITPIACTKPFPADYTRNNHLYSLLHSM